MKLFKKSQSIYSQFYVANGLTSTYLNEEVSEHFEQGFSVRKNSLAFSTLTDDEYSIEISDTDFNVNSLNEALFAIRVPCQFESGFVFVTGAMSPAPIELVEKFKKVNPTESELQQLIRDKGILIFPAMHAASVVFAEFPGQLIKLFIDKEEKHLKLLVANDSYTKQNNFLLDVEPTVYE